MGDKNASHSPKFLNQLETVRVWSLAWSLVLVIVTLFQTTPLTAQAQASDGKLRIIAFGAHPDDCELQASGTGALWAAKGHHVKFVSVTNGDIGHWREAGGPLALRRKQEVEKADGMLGITVEVLDIHDGELLPNMEEKNPVLSQPAFFDCAVRRSNWACCWAAADSYFLICSMRVASAPPRSIVASCASRRVQIVPAAGFCTSGCMICNCGSCDWPSTGEAAIENRAGSTTTASLLLMDNVIAIPIPPVRFAPGAGGGEGDS